MSSTLKYGKWYEVKAWFFRVSRPHCWIQFSDSNKNQDILINYLIDNDLSTRFGYLSVFFRAKDGTTFEIWTGNYPYAYGSTYGRMSIGSSLPYAITRKKLKKYLESKLMNELERNHNE